MPLDPQTLSLMRATIRRRLEEGATVREAAAEARGIASGREVRANPRQIEATVRDLLVEIDALLPDLPGCSADGETPEEAVRNLRAAVAAWIEEASCLGRPVPAPRAHLAVA